MIFHVLGVAHTKTNLDYVPCAYTMKVWNFCKMMKSLGHKVIHYGNEGSNPECDEQVNILSSSEFDSFYDNPKYYKKDFFDGNYENWIWKEFIKRAKVEIEKRINKTPGEQDFVISFFGGYFWKEGNKTPFVEAGIGYTGWCARFCVFESYYWLAYNYGLRKKTLGDYYHVVIPNYIDPDMFEFNNSPQDYFCFVGRLIPNKGLNIIKQISNILKIKIKVAGQGNSDLLELDKHPYIEFLGTVNVQQRRDLFKNAIASFAPTNYLEPFGGVAMEAQISGTPCIASDWGGFTENILHGVTGFRCRTFQDFCEAVERVKQLNRQNCRDFIINNNSINRVKWMYQDYFEKLEDVFKNRGWYTNRDDRKVKPLDWLNKWYSNG